MIRKRRDRTSFGARAASVLLAAAGVALVGTMVEPTSTRADEKAALKIGLLMDFSGGSAEILRDRQRAFELAIKHVNDGGGVLGLPVEGAVGDTTANPETAVAEARRLIEVERVHAIVGPNSSAASLPIAERVIGPAGVPTISFSATSPELTGVADNDFFFRWRFPTTCRDPFSPEWCANGASTTSGFSTSTMHGGADLPVRSKPHGREPSGRSPSNGTGPGFCPSSSSPRARVRRRWS